MAKNPRRWVLFAYCTLLLPIFLPLVLIEKFCSLLIEMLDGWKDRIEWWSNYNGRL